MNEARFSEISCQHLQVKHGLHFPSLCLNSLHSYYIFPLKMTVEDGHNFWHIIIGS